MRSASPPAGTAGRAGIAEASPAGERSGRDGAPGPAQGGETSTVDQSREWAFRDTAPRQDPAESRLDPIWGADPPDAVRWHVGMTPDQEPTTSRSSDIQTKSPHDPAGAVPAADPSSQASGAAGLDPSSDPATTIGVPAPRESIGAAGDQQVDQAPPEEGGVRPGPDWRAGEVRSIDEPSDQLEVSALAHGPSEGPGTSERQAAQGGHNSEEPVLPNPAGEPTGSPLAAASGTTVGPGGGDPAAASATSGGARDEVPGPGEATAADESAAEVPRGTEPNVGWFSAEGGASQYTGPLSERLSAERPSDELDGSSGHEASEGGGAGLTPAPGEHRSPELIESGMVHVDPDPEIGSPPRAAGWTEPPHGHVESDATDRSGTADRSRPVALQASQVAEGASFPGLDAARLGGPGATAEGGSRVASTESSSDADQALSDLDEIDHRERAVNDSDPSAAATAGETIETTVTPAEARSGTEATTETETPAVAGVESAEEGANGPGMLDSPIGSGSALDNTAAAAAAGSSAAGTASDPNGEPIPWSEPALPVAWPPGMEPPDRTERPEISDGESSDAEIRPQPDPTWPRLFGRTSEDQDVDTAGESTGTHTPRESIAGSAGEGEPSEPSQESRPPVPSRALADTAGDQPASGEMTSLAESQGSARDQLSTEAHQDSPSPKDGISSPGISEETEAASTGSPPVVDLTTTDRPEDRQGSTEAPESPEQTASARGLNAGAAEGTTLATEGTTPAGISTATRAEAAEVDVRGTSTTLPNVDVSRETSAGGGEGMEEEREDETLEDEAAIAVREAVTRAAAEAGVDVSRETEQLAQGVPIDELDQEPSVDTEAAARNARVTFRIHRDSLNGTRRVVAVANQKGGVGKSTTAVNIGAYLALAGARVLVVDLDPQGNASTGLGLDHREIEPSIYDVLAGEAVPAAAIRATGVANLHVLPSTIDLAGAEVELVSAMSRETRLRRALESVDHQYDTILIDCPPSLGLLTVNALAAADELLIPIQCEYYALEGLGQLLRNVELVRANLNPELRIGGIVLTMYDGRTRLALQVVDEVRRHFTDLVYQTVVPRSVRLSEAPGYGVPIALYDPLSRGGIAYRDLTFELAERSGLLAPTGEGAS